MARPIPREAPVTIAAFMLDIGFPRIESEKFLGPSRSAGEHLVRRDRGGADAFTGGVVDRVADRGRHADLPDLPHALGAEAADDAVVLVHENDVDVRSEER